MVRVTEMSKLKLDVITVDKVLAYSELNDKDLTLWISTEYEYLVEIINLALIYLLVLIKQFILLYGCYIL